MSETPANIVTEFLRQMAAPFDDCSDDVLLKKFAVTRESDLFSALVRRHGPMVLGVCRRHLGNTPDADDAFQATFLTLAKRPGAVRDCLPGWLHRVALRTSRKAARRGDRRTAPLPDLPGKDDPFAAVAWGELRTGLDDELGRLPDRLRSPLVLCYLDGLTRDEAAKRLGWSLRTLHRRLDEGRNALRTRLTRRGFAPALIGTAILSADGLRAAVSPRLARDTARYSTGSAAVSPAVRQLVPASITLGGLAMKTLFTIAVVGIATLLATYQPATADPVRAQQTPPPAVARAPLPKVKPPADPLIEKVEKAKAAGIKYLMGQAKDQGDEVKNWEDPTLGLLQPGGGSAMALLALLEAGVKPDDEAIQASLKYLRGLKPQNTYVVGLQTEVLCKANQKEDAEQIKTNVKWLVEAAVRQKKQLTGWSYTSNSGNRADNSNSRFAVVGLHAAHKAGFKVPDAKFWEEIRDFYLSSQTKAGSWNYTAGDSRGNGTHTMTCSGLLCLALAEDAIGKKSDKTKAATKAGYAWLAENFRFENAPHTFYNFDVISRLGIATKRKMIGEGDKARDWYREGCELLVPGDSEKTKTAQKTGGEWQIKSSIDDFPIISTSFALRFLSHRPE